MLWIRYLFLTFFLLLYSLTASAKYLSNINFTDDSITYPTFPDIYYEYQIAELNKTTPIEIEFNEHVKHYIELYTLKRRDEFAKIIGLSQLYFPIIEEYLDKNNLPLELKYLTIIESGLDPLAVSKSGAVGLWQFLLNTCEFFDLEVTSYIDERRDPYKSTNAACKYLKYLYTTFNDWNLVLASYNGGPGDVRKAISRSKNETSYWKLRPYLSKQAQNYVPAFIAAFYLMNNYKEHKIEIVKPFYNYNNIDSLHVHYSVKFEEISKAIDLPVEHIRFLNPQYKLDFIPEIKKTALLILPQNKILTYLDSEYKILGSESLESDYNLLVENAGNTDGKVKIIHTVTKGEFFHKIALKYNCTLENIKAWNNLKNNNIYPGQKLIIWIEEEDQQ